MENVKSISQIINYIDFEIQNNPAGFMLPDPLKPIKENEKINPSRDTKLPDKDFQKVLQISYNNKKDFGDAMFTQYSQSNLRSDKYIQRTSLFNEIGIKTNITNMFKNYIISHEKHIYKPLPETCNQLPKTFETFNDNMNIILQYQIKIQKLIDMGVINASAVHLDTLFVPPQRCCEFENMRVKGMVYSKPMNRTYRSGLKEIDTLFCGKKGKKIMNDINDCKRRLILMVVRGNEYDTNNDILYLFTQTIKGNLRQKKYEYNQVLWNINSKKDIICNNNNKYIDIKTKYLFNISYYLCNNKRKQWKMYMQYNGHGQRVFKDNIIKQWYMLFTNGINMCNNNKLIQQFKDYVETDISIQYGKCLFGVKYQTKIYTNITNQRYILYIPKDVLKDDIPNIREHFVDQKQLYYYLMWTCKMQIIDKQFIHYVFEDNNTQIGIFNCELHNKHSNNALYVVCTLNEMNNNWTMLGFMKQYDIYHEYGINYEIDLPKGTRHLHKSFNKTINENYMNLKQQYEIIPIDYRNLDIISCAKSPKSIVYDIQNESNNLINYIVESINNINSKQNNISLIPILQIDSHNEIIYCETLIPVKLPSKQSYIGVSYNTIGNKIKIQSIYTDCNEILNKATLVNPNAYDAYKYLISNNNNNNIYNNDNDKKDNILLKKLASDQSWRIESLQKELQAALQREHLLLSMLMQTKANANVCMPITPALFNYNSDSPSLPPFQPILYNNSNNSNNSNTSNNSNSYSNSPPLSSYQATITNFNFCIGK